MENLHSLCKRIYSCVVLWQCYQHSPVTHLTVWFSSVFQLWQLKVAHSRSLVLCFPSFCISRITVIHTDRLFVQGSTGWDSLCMKTRFLYAPPSFSQPYTELLYLFSSNLLDVTSFAQTSSARQLSALQIHHGQTLEHPVILEILQQVFHLCKIVCYILLDTWQNRSLWQWGLWCCCQRCCLLRNYGFNIAMRAYI
jgi:hypothetical protein